MRDTNSASDDGGSNLDDPHLLPNMEISSSEPTALRLPSLLSVELRLLPLLCLLVGAHSGVVGVVEQWVITGYCRDLMAADCSDALVGEAASRWYRWVVLVGQVTALTMLPAVGIVSDVVKAGARSDPLARVPILLVQLAIGLTFTLGCFLHAQLALPRPVQLFTFIVGNLQGGQYGVLTVLFALRSDLSSVGQRPAAFVRLELALFAGVALGQRAAGAMMGRSHAFGPRAAREKIALGVFAAVQCLAVLLIVIGFTVSPPGGAAPPKPSRCAAWRAVPRGAELCRQLRARVVASITGLARFRATNPALVNCILVAFTMASFNNGLGGYLVLYLNNAGWDSQAVANLISSFFSLSALYLLLTAALLSTCAPATDAVARLTAFGMAGGVVGPLLLVLHASRPAIPPMLYPICTATVSVSFPLFRSMITGLFGAERAGSALSALGLLEHITATSGGFIYMTLFSAAAHTSPELPLMIASMLFAVGTLVACGLPRLIRATGTAHK